MSPQNPKVQAAYFKTINIQLGTQHFILKSGKKKSTKWIIASYLVEGVCSQGSCLQQSSWKQMAWKQLFSHWSENDSGRCSVPWGKTTMERRRCVWPLCFSLVLLFIYQSSENVQIFHESKLRWENNI